MIVIGLGNAWRGDDGAGLAVAERVGGIGVGGDLVDLCQRWDAGSDVVVVDAMVSGSLPGTVIELDGLTGDLPPTRSALSTHAFDLPTAIELARRLGRLPARLRVIGIEGACFDIGSEMSPPVQAAVDRIVAHLGRPIAATSFPSMGDDIRTLAEEHWAGRGDLVHEHHPVRMVNARAAEEIIDGVLYVKSIASVNAIDTGDGIVMLDTGGAFDTDHIYTTVRAWRSGERGRLAAAVYSHHHVDHVFGTKRFEAEATEHGWAGPTVYAHEDLPEHFHRYERTNGWNARINQRQFALPVDTFTWPADYRYPDVTYENRLTFTQGELTFELHHARGETDDATWTYVPELKVLHPGDLFIWAVPNAGNPQKVQRYVSDWAAALREMAAAGAEIMLAGHGLPIFGRERVAEACGDTAELLDSLEAQTIALMNTGAALDTVIHTVEVPVHLRDKPWLKPVYDHPQFIVRNVWRRYGGWYDGEPDNLLPAPRRQQAEEWVTLAGGVAKVLARARALAAAGDHRMACHLVEYAVIVAPTATEVHETRTAIYRERAMQYDSSMARNILNHAAFSSERLVRDLAGGW